MLKVDLSSVGNPDFGQDPHRPMSEPEIVEVETLEAASEACREYIERHNLGGGNWSGGNVYEEGQKVARISYNGRIWSPDRWPHAREYKPGQGWVIREN